MNEHPVKDLGPGLVLTRRVGQYLIVNEGELLIQVTEIKGKQVRLKFIGKAKLERAEKFDTVTQDLADEL